VLPGTRLTLFPSCDEPTCLAKTQLAIMMAMKCHLQWTFLKANKKDVFAFLLTFPRVTAVVLSA